MTDLVPGTTFAGHRIQAVAGRGGMGVVYRATQLDLERTVALKVIAPAFAEDPEFRVRFTRESRVAASIDHPNVIPIYYAGEHEGVLYIAMRYVEGEDLRALLGREGALETGRAAHLVSQVGAALDAAHARGIVHRDVKPANVLLGSGDHAYLTDFGLTKGVGSNTGLSRAGQWVGTLGYVAPEQIRGEAVDARADVYALGCLLFFALTGASPYRRDSDEATLWAHLNDPPPSPCELVAGIPESFDAVVARAMAKDPADRFPSGGDLGRAALAAAGRISATPPERRVATGAAAPPGDAPTVVSPGASGRPQHDAAGDPAGDTPTALAPRRRDARRRAALVAAPIVVAAIALAAILIADGGDDGAPSPSRARVVATVGDVGARPNDVAVAGGYAWALSGIDGTIAAVSTATNRRAPFTLRPGSGASAISAGYGALWVVKQATNNVLRYRLTGRHDRVGNPIGLPPGVPFAVVAGPNGVWVGSRSGRDRNALVQQSVSRIDPRTSKVLSTDAIADGVQDLAVGYDAVWIANRRASTVTRLDIATHLQRRIPLDGLPKAIAVGAGAVWVTIADRNELVRIDPRTRRRITVAVGLQPRGVAAAGDTVWVSNQTDSTVMRIDPRTRRRVGGAIDVGTNPKAMALDGPALWVANVGDDSLSRIGF